VRYPLFADLLLFVRLLHVKNDKNENEDDQEEDDKKMAENGL